MEAYQHLVFDVQSMVPAARAAAPDGVDLEEVVPAPVHVEMLTLAEASELNRAPNLVVPEVLPITHIASVETASGPKPTSTSWGIEVVGAATHPLNGKGACVAVLDSGIDTTHPAFAGVDVVKANFTAPSNAPDSHATHCAATILGRDVDGVRVGVAPGVTRLLDAQVIGGGTAALIDAVNWAAANGAHIISMSLGIDFVGFVAKLRKEGLPEGAAMSRALVAYQRTIRIFDNLAALAGLRGGSLLIAAAGNSSNRSATPPYVIDCEPPAISPGVIAVGALRLAPDRMVRLCSFSNQGVALAAPGEDIWSAVRGGGLAPDSGTSTAVPHVAGIAALYAQQLLEASGAVDPALLRARLVGGAQPLPGSTNADVGAGLVQAPH